ncbi:MAG: paraquat-inducible protein A [Sulfuritalea sp.]|nr:paraquat-inducible protein A [Sulfuritalea sp.]
MSLSTLVACLECDLLHRRIQLPPGGEARCVRCRALLYRATSPNANERALALALAAGIVMIVANVFPIVDLELQGVHNSATLWEAVRSMWDDKARAVAVLVFVTTIFVPLAELVGLIWVLAALRSGIRGYGTVPILHFIERVKPWGMVEVFMLGVLVSLVKLAHVASIEPGAALLSFAVLMMLIAAAAAAFDADAAWEQLEATL